MWISRPTQMPGSRFPLYRNGNPGTTSRTPDLTPGPPLQRPPIPHIVFIPGAGFTVKARDHTDRMFEWWRAIGVDRVDLAVRRPRYGPHATGPAWLWQHSLPLVDLPRFMPWTRAENAQNGDIYARPARGPKWPVVFLDDLVPARALDLTTHHPGLCVRTSPEGGCQLWLGCERPLDEQERYRLQKHLVVLHGADPGSVSGEHLGRLAGYRNWKRRGPWVNVLAATLAGPSLLAPRILNSESSRPLPRHLRSQQQGRPGRDTSESGREWGWVLGALQAGLDPEIVYHRLLDRARDRRGSDAERYARRTIERAIAHIAMHGHRGGASD